MLDGMIVLILGETEFIVFVFEAVYRDICLIFFACEIKHLVYRETGVYFLGIERFHLEVCQGLIYTMELALKGIDECTVEVKYDERAVVNFHFF